MTAYEAIQQHPEWVTSERVPRAAIQERAKRYVSDYKGNGNFAKGVTEDLDDLLRRRDATNDFAGIVADGDTPQVNTESPEYLADKRKAKICAIFVKAVISELAGRSICTAAQIQEWRERYGVKLEGLQGKSKKETKEFEPIGLDEERATKIYNWAFRSKRIECTEDDFIWYFGKKTDRTNSLQPNPIKWNGKRNELAYLCGRCADFTKSDKKEYITDSLYAKSRKDDTKWKGVYAAIFGLDENERIRTQRTLSRIKRGSDNAPGCWNEIDALFK